MSFQHVKALQSGQAHNRCLAGVGSYDPSYYCSSYRCLWQPCPPEPVRNNQHPFLVAVMPFGLRSTVPGTIIIGIHHGLWVLDLLRE